MTQDVAEESHSPQPGDLEADRRRNLERLRDEYGMAPFGRRVDGLIDLATARSRFDPAADAQFKQQPEPDPRPTAHVAGRVMQQRVMGNLVFLRLRDASADLQVAVSKKSVDARTFALARLLDLGDIVTARGPLGTTKTGEVTLWAGGETGLELAVKSLAPPPGKWEGHTLQNPELRYRKRYVDMYANPEVAQTFQKRSQLVAATRRFFQERGFLEVETPMLQAIAGGAAARPFITHHNALDIDLFLRIAPELYLKRLLVGGLPRVFEINRNFRNEGIDRSHNPEFTMLELYQAFADYRVMMEHTEQLLHALATSRAGGAELPYGDLTISYALPFARKSYHGLFAEVNGYDPADDARLRQQAQTLHIDAAGKDHDVLLNEVWEETVEATLVQPTFVMDYPASLCPLTRTKVGDATMAERFELFIAGMEIANAYTELNDPDVQRANFERQVAGLDDEEATFRTMDHDFLEALRVGMPPAGGLGIGIDRVVMLMTNSRSIRDVILFPLLRPQS